MCIPRLSDKVELSDDVAKCVVSALSALTENWENCTSTENLQAYLDQLTRDQLNHFSLVNAVTVDNLQERLKHSGLCDILIDTLDSLCADGEPICNHIRLWWADNWPEHSGVNVYPIQGNVLSDDILADSAFYTATEHELMWYTPADPEPQNRSSHRDFDLLYAKNRYELAQFTISYFEQFITDKE